MGRSTSKGTAYRCTLLVGYCRYSLTARICIAQSWDHRLLIELNEEIQGENLAEMVTGGPSGDAPR